MLSKQQRRIFTMHRVTRRIKVIEDLRSKQRPVPYNVSHQVDGDIYQFGVFTGGGLKAWVDAMPAFNMSFPRHLWGFDSFVGMPHEPSNMLKQQHRQDPAWQAGGLSASEKLQTFDWPILNAELIRNIGYDASMTHLIKGFYNESLAGGAELARRYGMRPALIVDIDCDLYSSTKQALEFMLGAGLLVPGSFVSYDDISDKEFVAATQRNGSAFEELLAHVEVTRSWEIRWLQLPALGPYPGPMGGGLSWVKQYSNASAGLVVPPEWYVPVVELQYCRRCERLATASERQA